MDARYTPSFYSACLHRRVEVITNGRRNFYAGEVWDDYGELVVCLDCQCTLSEKDVRETWAGRGSSNHASQQER